MINITKCYECGMLEPLRHFALVAQHGTFTAAARHAYVTQPALTASIQRLEAEMESKLFVRSHGSRARATLTAAGEALLPSARAALAAVEEGRRAVAEITGLAAGTVRLGAGATVCTYYLPRTLARFRNERPGVRIHLREGHPEDLLDALESGELDLVIHAHVGPRKKPDIPVHLSREKWIDDELVLVGAPGVDPKTAPLVTFGRGATTRTLSDRLFPSTPIAMELASIAAVKGNTRAGVGVALVSRRAAQRDFVSGSLVELPAPRTPVIRPLYLVHRGRDRLPPAAGELYRLLRAQRGY
jgi:DNA-binding transcriptional LysR family regulator